MQASNSLLTRKPLLFVAKPFARAALRNRVRAGIRVLRNFHTDRGESTDPFPVPSGLPHPPHSVFRPRLGEGSVRGLHVSCALFVSLFGWCLMPASGLRGLERTVISLKEEATVGASTVFLGDVADISGGDPEVVRQLAKLPVAQAPGPGLTVTIHRGLVQDKVVGSLLIPADVSISGAAAAHVRIRGRAVTADEVVPLLVAGIAGTTSWRQQEIEIRSIGNLGSAELPPGDAALRVPQKHLLTGAVNSLVPLEVTIDGKPSRTFWITADIRIRAEVVRAVRAIPYGKTIAREDVAVSTVEITDARITCLRRVEDAVGLVSRRAISQGDPLTRESLANPLLVRSGETVHLRLERSGVHLAGLARAEQDGRLGQVIRIRNLDFSRSLKARVVGRGEVRIE